MVEFGGSYGKNKTKKGGGVKMNNAMQRIVVGTLLNNRRRRPVNVKLRYRWIRRRRIRDSGTCG